MSYPVQSPDNSPFCFDDLVWDLTHTNGIEVNVCYIPSSRIQEFMDGENRRGNTQYFTYKVYKPNNRTLANTRYWCSFGPRDDRENIHAYEGQTSHGDKDRRKRQARGETMKVGCQCNYAVRVLRDESDVAEIVYFCKNHIDENENVCHGTGFEFQNPRMNMAPKLSWNDQKSHGMIRNENLENLVTSAVLKAKHIPHSHISIQDNTLMYMLSTSNDSWYSVNLTDGKTNCNCPDAQRGNMCKHQCRLLMENGFSESYLIRKYGTNVGTNIGESSQCHPIPEQFHDLEEPDNFEQPDRRFEQLDKRAYTDDDDKEIWRKSCSNIAEGMEDILHISGETRDLALHGDFLIRKVRGEMQDMYEKTKLQRSVSTAPRSMLKSRNEETENTIKRAKGFVERLFGKRKKK